MKVGVREIPELGVGVAPQHSLLQMGDLMESIHVQLANERAEILVLEPAPQHFSGEALVVENFMYITLLHPIEYVSVVLTKKCVSSI